MLLESSLPRSYVCCVCSLPSSFEATRQLARQAYIVCQQARALFEFVLMSIDPLAMQLLHNSASDYWYIMSVAFIPATSQVGDIVGRGIMGTSAALPAPHLRDASAVLYQPNPFEHRQSVHVPMASSMWFHSSTS